MGCRPATAASAAHLWEDPMGTKLVALATAILASLTLSTSQAAEPKHGGILRVYHRETPPRLSIHEEATFSVNAPAMGLFNNLVIYDQHKPQNSMGTIVPELADSWAWSKDNLSLTFKLHQDVKWHDGQPFTSKDVKCTFDLIQGKGQDKFRKNPRKDLFNNISDVSTNGDFEVTLQLKRPQRRLRPLELQRHLEVAIGADVGNVIEQVLARILAEFVLPLALNEVCLLYTSPSPRDRTRY